MNYNEAEKYIHSFTRFGSQLGLERMRRLLSLMGNPQDKLKFIHVAGTNGKGSTVKMSASVLEKAGYKVGMYISPFVIDFRERYQINGKMISKSEFASLVNGIRPLVDKLAQDGDMVTEFEAVTAVGFEFFYRNKCDIVCLEVGLGGKFDATNVIGTPLAAIITSISLDHTEILGNTVALIAGEKAGIIKKNTTVFTYPVQGDDAVAVFMEKCAKTDSTLCVPNKNSIEIISSDIFGSKFNYGGEEYSIRLVGEHQVYNAVVVIEAMRYLNQRGFDIPQEIIKSGIRQAKFPARFEIMSKSPLVILDGTHNGQAAQALATTLKRLDKSPKIAIMGMMADKDCDTALSFVLKECGALITVPVNNPRTISPEELAQKAKGMCESVFVEHDYKKALCRAVELSGDDGAVIICGSFYMASDMRGIVKELIKEAK